ncbi:hypothetical protein LG301_07085 [Vreelandella venusta]|uniref:hypothetical protein n=1 Tax=Vreelandella venusta TaxID=44935 RepID=UPI00384E9586
MLRVQAIHYQRLKLIMIFVLFAAPMAAAWGMVKWGVGIPNQHTAHGEVEVMAPNLYEWALVDPLESSNDVWTLAFECTVNCEKRKDELWRLHRALGREAPRLQRLRIGGAIQALPGEQVNQWQQPPAWRNESVIWLMDPMGVPALAFNEQANASDILDDIRHLFKVNHH